MAWFESLFFGLKRSGLFAFWVLLTMSLMLTACFGGRDAETPVEQPAAEPALLSGNVVLQCSKACSNRGQCGTAVNEAEVVFGSKIGPSVDNHDVLFPTNIVATIQNTDTRAAEEISSTIKFNLNFYQVALADGSQSGWVTEWCVQPQP